MHNAPFKDIADIAHEMKSRGDTFAIATVVRTVSLTAAKPGAKAIIDANGTLVDGWIGGGCASRAVLKAAVKAIEDGKATLVSIQPEELMSELDGDVESQVVKATNMCPSKGSMDIFIEPVLAYPELLVIGNSPVAIALVTMADLFDLKVNVHKADEPVAELDFAHPHRYIVVSTQGAGDLKALQLALSLESRHVGFVGSRRKIEHLQQKLEQQGLSQERTAIIKSPAGLDINAVTPQEIALSIIAEIVLLRRSA